MIVIKFIRAFRDKKSIRGMRKADFYWGLIVLALVIYMLIDSMINGYVSDNPGFW
jgi:hypothetical protein